MIEFIRIFESYYLYEVEIMKTKLASRGIESYIKNEFINNVALMPVNQFYILYVKSKILNWRKVLLMKMIPSTNKFFNHSSVDILLALFQLPTSNSQLPSSIIHLPTPHFHLPTSNIFSLSLRSEILKHIPNEY